AAARAAPRAGAGHLGASKSGASDAGAPAWDGLTVVVFEDDEALREVLPTLLAGPRLRVEAAGWQADAGAFVAARSPDLVLLDVDANSETAALRVRHLRDQPALRGIPLVLFSSADEWTLRSLARETGANGYLTKSALGGDVATTVRKLLAQPPRRP